MGVEPRFGDTQRQLELWMGHRAAVGKPYEIRGGQGGAEELVAFIEAVEANPSTSNISALIAFIQDETGEMIEDLTAPTWAQVAADGVQRTHELTILGVTFTVTIDGTPAVGVHCPLNEGMHFTFPQTQFDLPTLNYYTPPVAPSTLQVIGMPDVTVEIQQPEFVYVPNLLPPDFTDPNPLYAALGWRDQTNDALTGTDDSGVSWINYVRIKGRWTTNIVLKTTEPPSATTFRYQAYPPLFAVGSSTRWPVGNNYDIPWDPDLPPVVGTWPAYGTNDNVIVRPDPDSPDTDYPDTFFDGVGGNLAYNLLGSQSWFHTRPSKSTGGSFGFLAQTNTASSESAAWTLFMAKIDAYNAERTIYDPVVTVDATNKTLTAVYETDESAMYVQLVGCNVVFNPDVVDTAYNFLTAIWGGYRWQGNVAQPWEGWYSGDSGTTFTPGTVSLGPLHRYIAKEEMNLAWHQDDTTVGTMSTSLDRVAPTTQANDPEIVDAEAPDLDGEPPETTPSPPPVNPVGGGCKASIDGPSSCNWTVPPSIDPTPEFPLPGDMVGEMPVFDTKFPEFPPMDCLMPDFGNMDACGDGGPGGSGYGGGGGGPGFNGPLPGGRDRTGRAGNRHAGLKTGGPTYGPPRTRTFDKKKCYPEGTSIMGMITDLLLLAGVQAIDIVFQIDNTWDKTLNRDKCFRKGSRIFDAASWAARMLMCEIIDEGPPTHNVYIGPPWHRPGQVTHHFMDHFPNTDGYLPLFNIAPAYSSEDMVDFVEVFGAHLSSPVIAEVDSPFAPNDGSSKLIEVGPDFSQADAEDWAAYHAARIRRKSVSVQVTVPYDTDYFLRDKMVTHLPSRGFEETWIVFGKESQLARDGHFHVLTGVLPATVAELERFPTVIEE
jgi:hypothetical protein